MQTLIFFQIKITNTLTLHFPMITAAVLCMLQSMITVDAFLKSHYKLAYLSRVFEQVYKVNYTWSCLQCWSKLSRGAALHCVYLQKFSYETVMKAIYLNSKIFYPANILAMVLGLLAL